MLNRHHGRHRHCNPCDCLSLVWTATSHVVDLFTCVVVLQQCAWLQAAFNRLLYRRHAFHLSQVAREAELMAPKKATLPDWIDEELRGKKSRHLVSASPLPPVEIDWPLHGDMDEEQEGQQVATEKMMIAYEKSGIQMRRAESTMRSGIVSGAGFLWEEGITIADFDQLKVSCI